MITVVFIFNGFLSTFSQQSNYSFIHVFQDTLPVRLIHSHKKRKDSLKTWAERAVLRAYVENQAVLEPILPYRGSKYKQKGQVLRLFVNSNFTFLSEQYQGFSFLYEDTNMSRSNLVKKVLQLFKETNQHYMKHRMEVQNIRWNLVI